MTPKTNKNGLTAFLAIIRRDLLLAYRYRAEVINPILYFIIIVSLYPLAISPDPKVLTKIAPGIIWVAALLASLLSLDNLFRSDYEDGTLEQMLMSPHPTGILVLAKIVAHWITTGLPLLLVAPVLAYTLHLDPKAYSVLMITLIIGTPILSFVGAIGIALTVGLRRGGMLLSILVLPLFLPILVLSSVAIQLAASPRPAIAPIIPGAWFDSVVYLTTQAPYSAAIYTLSALLILAITLAPLATAAALRISLR